MSRIEKIDWFNGIRIRQRIEIPSANLPRNFKIRPYSTQEVMKIESGDFPLEDMLSLEDLAEWIDNTLAPILPDGIFYLQAYGDYSGFYEKKNKWGNVIRDERGRVIWKKKFYKGIVSLCKFEIFNGSFSSFIAKRGIMLKKKSYWRKIRYNRDFRNRIVKPSAQPSFELMKWFGYSSN